MKVNRLSPDIYEIEDFITVDQQTKILEYCQSLDESDWWHEEQEGNFLLWQTEVRPTPSNFLTRSIKMFKTFFQMSYMSEMSLYKDI